MSKKLLFITIITAVCLSAAGILIARPWQQAKRFVKITYQVTGHRPDGQIEDQGKRVRFVDIATSEWKETAYTPLGDERNTVLNSQQGVFRISKRKNQISPMGEFHPVTDVQERLAKQKAVGNASVLGHSVYIGKSKEGFTEIWSSSEFGSNVPLKIMMCANAEKTICTIFEAVELSVEATPAADFFQPPNLPIDLAQLEAQLEAAKDRNDQRGVERYARLLAKWKK